MEFSPLVSEYRLIGYENRLLNREDFKNDKIDAGEIGAGHTVTALYEITPVGAKELRIDPLRYQGKYNRKSIDMRAQEPLSDGHIELAYLKVRYKKPGDKVSQLITQPILSHELQPAFQQSSVDMRFATAVAGFGQLLRGGKYIETLTYKDVHKMAVDARGRDPYGYRGEFIQLVLNAQALTTPVNSGREKTLSHYQR